MSGLPSFRDHRRVVVAVIALYGFLLQGLVSGWLPQGPSPASEHGILCSPDGAPLDRTDHHGGHDCCLAAVQMALPAPDRTGRTHEPPDRVATMLVWRVEAAHRATGPPTNASSARGPPQA